MSDYEEAKKYRMLVTDFCYNCGHKLGDHRASGRCDKAVYFNKETGDIKMCGCEYHQFKEPED